MDDLHIIEVKSRRDSYFRGGNRFSKKARLFGASEAAVAALVTAGLAGQDDLMTESGFELLQADPVLNLRIGLIDAETGEISFDLNTTPATDETRTDRDATPAPSQPALPTTPPAPSNEEVEAIVSEALKASMAPGFKPTKTALEGVAKSVRDALRDKGVEFQKVASGEKDGVITIVVTPPGDADEVTASEPVPTEGAA